MDNKNDMATMLNYKEHAKQLDVPVLNEFQLENDNNPMPVDTDSGRILYSKAHQSHRSASGHRQHHPPDRKRAGFGSHSKRLCQSDSRSPGESPRPGAPQNEIRPQSAWYGRRKRVAGHYRLVYLPAGTEKDRLPAGRQRTVRSTQQFPKDAGAAGTAGR